MDPVGEKAPIRVVLADDHPIWRDGVRADLDERFTVVGEAGEATEAIRVIEASRPDVVVCDLHMPGGGGIAVARAAAMRPTSSCSRSPRPSATYSTRSPPARSGTW